MLHPRSSSAYSAGRSFSGAAEEEAANRKVLGSSQTGWLWREAEVLWLRGAKSKPILRGEEKRATILVVRGVQLVSVLCRRLQELLHWKAVLQRRDNLVRTVSRRKTHFLAYY